MGDVAWRKTRHQHGEH